MLALTDILLDNSTPAAEHNEEPEDKKKRKKKMEKDPNAPKRNLSSYMLYSQAVRPETVATHPDLKAVDIAKLIGEKWNALTDKEKQPFIKQAEREKARFDKEITTYKATLGEDHDDTPTKRKAEEPKKKNEDEPTKKKSKSSSKKKN